MSLFANGLELTTDCGQALQSRLFLQRSIFSSFPLANDSEGAAFPQIALPIVHLLEALDMANVSKESIEVTIPWCGQDSDTLNLSFDDDSDGARVECSISLLEAIPAIPAISFVSEDNPIILKWISTVHARFTSQFAPMLTARATSTLRKCRVPIVKAFCARWPATRHSPL